MAKQPRSVLSLTRLAALVAAGLALPLPGAAAQAQSSESALPSFLDDRRLPLTEVEAKEKAEADRQKAAEAEARRQAEDERRRAAEAAEAEARAQAEAQALQKEEDERRQAAEAEARQKAEEERRRMAAEAEAKQNEARQKAEEERRRAAATASAAQSNAQAAAATGCAPDRIAAQALSGGRVSIEVTAPCRPGQMLTLRYGSYEFQHALDGSGRTTAMLDLFQGKTAPVSLQLGDGPRQVLSLEAVDLSGISKIAVLWRAPVNLDLHIYEYAAHHGGPGHVWADAPSSVEAAEAEAQKTRRGRGFLSSKSDGRGGGDKAEVYTFFHHGEQQSGLIATALDYETRGAAADGETCGNGAHASVVYDAIILALNGEVSRERGAIAAVACGAQLSAAGRYLEDAILDLSIRP